MLILTYRYIRTKHAQSIPNDTIIVIIRSSEKIEIGRGRCKQDCKTGHTSGRLRGHFY